MRVCVRVCVCVDCALPPPPQARQRAGRAGREGRGRCYRLYPEAVFGELAEETVPEILRCPLSSVALQLLALGVADLLSFDFMAAPEEEALVQALEGLYLLGAVEKETERLRLSALGQRMAHFPLEPHLARALIASQVGCHTPPPPIPGLGPHR